MYNHALLLLCVNYQKIYYNPTVVEIILNLLLQYIMNPLIELIIKIIYESVIHCFK